MADEDESPSDSVAGGVSGGNAPPDTPRPGDRRFQIVNYVGIADQLLTTRANRILADGDLPLAQFVMLNHFSHEPARGRSVTEIASAFEAPQPGITKMLQRLVRKGLIEVRGAPGDARVRLHHLTAKGRRAHARALERVLPEVARLFADWAEEDVAKLHALLFRLKSELDRARDPPAQTPG
jgi:DNA-binding MarR family transcriptional regulator